MGAKLHNWAWVLSHSGTYVWAGNGMSTKFHSSNGNVIWCINGKNPEIASKGWKTEKFRKISDDVDFCVKDGKIVEVKDETTDTIQSKESTMKRNFTVDQVIKPKQTLDKMDIGDFAIVTDKMYNGTLIYKSYKGHVEMIGNIGGNFTGWTSPLPDLEVEILKPGTKITITV